MRQCASLRTPQACQLTGVGCQADDDGLVLCLHDEHPHAAAGLRIPGPLELPGSRITDGRHGRQERGEGTPSLPPEPCIGPAAQHSSTQSQWASSGASASAITSAADSAPGGRRCQTAPAPWRTPPVTCAHGARAWPRMDMGEVISCAAGNTPYAAQDTAWQRCAYAAQTEPPQGALAARLATGARVVMCVAAIFLKLPDPHAALPVDCTQPGNELVRLEMRPYRAQLSACFGSTCFLACLGSTQAAGRAGAGAARCGRGVSLYTESPFFRWGHPGAGRGQWRSRSMQLPAERRELSDPFCTQHWPQHISLEAHMPGFASPGARGSLCCAAVCGVLPQRPAPWRRVAPLGRIMG